jgi:hypothetical protein
VKFTMSALPMIQRVFHTLGMTPTQRIVGFLWFKSVKPLPEHIEQLLHDLVEAAARIRPALHK